MQKQVFRIVTKEQNGSVIHEYPMKEVLSIATKLGMDMEIDTQYTWFLKQALITLLPKDWRRESDPKGRIKYHNVQTNATTATHPLLYQRNNAQQRPAPGEDDRSPTTYQTQLFRDLVQEQVPRHPMKEAGLKDSEEFYSSIMGLNETKPPHFIEELAEYQQASPTEMMDMAQKLGIGADWRYFWIARMALVFPLPPCWETIYNSLGQTQYLNTEHDIIQDEHPSLHFLQKLVSRLSYNRAATNSELMFFYDKQLLPYVVDLSALCAGSLSYRMQPDFAEARGFIKAKKTFYHGDRDMKEVIEDMMLLELTKIAAIDPDADLHLVGSVYKFINNMKAEGLMDKWMFRYTIEGERYWYNTPEERAYRHFPYAKSMKSFIKRKRKKYSDKMPDYQRTPAQRHPLFQKYGDELCYLASEEARLMMATLLKNMLEANVFEMPKEDFDVEEVFRRVEGKLSKEEALSVLFSNPYTLNDQDLVTNREDGPLEVSTDSEIFREIGFKLEGDKIVFVADESNRKDGLRGVMHNRNLIRTRIVPRRRDKTKTVKLNQELLLPFSAQIEKVLKRMKSLKDEEIVTPVINSETSSDSFSDSNESREEKDIVVTLDTSKTNLKGKLLYGDFFPTDEMEPDDTSRSLPVFEFPSNPGTEPSSCRTPDPEEPHLSPHFLKTPATILGSRKSGSSRHSSNKKKKNELQGSEDSLESEDSVPDKGAGKSTAQDVPTLETTETLDLINSGKGENRQTDDLQSGSSNVQITKLNSSPDSRHPGDSTSEFFLNADSASQEEVAKKHLLGRFSEGIMESYFDGLDLSPQNDRPTTRKPGVEKPAPLSGWLSPRTVLGGFDKLLRPVISKEQLQGKTGLHPSDPRLHTAKSRLPPLDESDGGRVKTAVKMTPKSSVGRNISSRQEALKPARTAAMRTRPQLYPHTNRPVTQTTQSTDGLPEDFVLSPGFKVASPQQYLKSEVPLSPAQIRILNFLHYVTMVGFPMSAQADVKGYPAPGEVLPQHVIKMGKRLGLKVSSLKFASSESDLLWISLLQLSCPLPRQGSSITGQLAASVLLPTGQHPGDEFFLLMVSFNRRLRTYELSRMPREDTVQNMIKESWLCLNNLRNKSYCYNFLTGAKVNLHNVPELPNPDLSKDTRAIALKQYLEKKLSKNQTEPVLKATPKKPEEERKRTAFNLANLLL